MSAVARTGVWSIEQVRAVRALRGSATAGEEISRHADWLARMQEQATRLVWDMAVVWAVDRSELLPDDFEVFCRADDVGLSVTVAVWWLPSTNEVRFVGGPLDGEVMDVAAIDSELLAEEYADAWAPGGITRRRRVVYLLDGWDPATHQWIFSPSR